MGNHRLTRNGPVFCFTSDLDWASEYCIRELRSVLDSFGIRPTLFVTHSSAEVASWSTAEKAVHPNFWPGSSHGSSQTEIIDHVFSLVPTAESYRCHRFFDSTPVAVEMRERGIRYDSNICLHLQPELAPLRHVSGLLRFPVFWEDDGMWLNRNSWDMDLDAFFTPGLKILNFHPFMLATNCPGAEHYDSIRHLIPILDETTVESATYSGQGERDFLLRVLSAVTSRGFRFYTLGEIFRMATSLRSDQIGRQSAHSEEEYRRYWSLSEAERQEFLHNSYAQRDATDPYATSRDYNARELEIQSLLENIIPGRMVDLGCGNGVTLLRIAEKLIASEMIGVDFSEHLIEGAKRLALSSPLEKRPRFLCADAIEYIASAPDASLDCVITERFIQNLPSKERQRQVMSDIFRALKPGGRALVCEGSDEGFEKLNNLRASVGLAGIPATSADNVTAIRLEDTEFERFAGAVGFILAAKHGYSWFFTVARVLHPLLVAPESPRFDAKINDIARQIQAHLPFDPGYGGNTLWVFTKP